MNKLNYVEDINTSTTSSSSSKMEWFVSPFKECYEKFKESCHHQQQPRRCDTDRNRYHYFRKWKNKNKSNTGSYKSKSKGQSQCESVEEVIISPECEREKQTEYQNELERIDYVKQLKTTDPENYELGCLMLKWYFENKTRKPTTPETIQENSQLQLPQDTSPLKKSTSPKKHNETKFTMVNNNIEKQNVKVKKFKQNPMINSKNKDIETLNERMVNDLLHMIDDHIDETVRSKRNKLLG